MNDELACADKLTFDSRRAAENAAVSLKWRHGTDLKAYQCRQCQLWHLTSA